MYVWFWDNGIHIIDINIDNLTLINKKKEEIKD